MSSGLRCYEGSDVKTHFFTPPTRFCERIYFVVRLEKNQVKKYQKKKKSFVKMSIFSLHFWSYTLHSIEQEREALKVSVVQNSCCHQHRGGIGRPSKKYIFIQGHETKSLISFFNCTFQGHPYIVKFTVLLSLSKQFFIYKNCSFQNISVRVVEGGGG